MMRSKSLHRQPEPRSERRGKKPDNQTPRISTPTIGRGARAWGVRNWLSQASSSPQHPPRGTGSYRLDSGLSLSPPLRERQLLQLHNQTPAMTLVLKRLRELLPPFCQAMADCQFVKCCSLLTTAMSSTLVHTAGQASSASSPPIFGGAPSPQGKASPGRSPIRAWLGVETTALPTLDETNAAAVLESKMEVFFLLVGVESMYQSMAHSVSLQFAQLLANGYEQIVKDLQLLRLTLCDAFLVRHESARTDATSQPSPDRSTAETEHLTMTESISTLATSLLVLVAFCQARAQCIRLQSALWQQTHQHATQPNLGEMAALFESILANLLVGSQASPKATSNRSSSAEVQALADAAVKEIGAWAGLCQTAFSVQNCR